MTLPAHRFREREERKATDGGKVFVCDFDETVTTAPKLIAHLTAALKAYGDKVYVLTGNDSPRDELLQRLKDYNISFDDLIQYHDSQSDGIARAHYLKQLDAYCGVDNRIDRAGTYVQACPHLFLVAEPPKIADENADGSKKAAKKAAKKVKRSVELRGAPHAPPNLRPMDTPGEHCLSCDMFWQNQCWGYGQLVDGKLEPYPVEDDEVCNSWTPDDGD